MQILDLDYAISDKFLMEVKRKLKNIHPDCPFTCRGTCPLSKTLYAGICVSWMNNVMEKRNVADPYRRYKPNSCRDLFSYVFKHVLVSENKKQNKI